MSLILIYNWKQNHSLPQNLNYGVLEQPNLGQQDLTVGPCTWLERISNDITIDLEILVINTNLRGASWRLYKKMLKLAKVKQVHTIAALNCGTCENFLIRSVQL